MPRSMLKIGGVMTANREVQRDQRSRIVDEKNSAPHLAPGNLRKKRTTHPNKKRQGKTNV